MEKYILDTVALDIYLKIKKRKECNRISRHVNKDNFFSFVSSNLNNIVINSATLFELYNGCIKNNKIQNDYKQKNLVNLESFRLDYEFMFNENKFLLLNEACLMFDYNKFVGNWNDGKSFYAKDYINQKIEFEIKSIEIFFEYLCLIYSNNLFEEFGDVITEDILTRFIASEKQFVKYNLKAILEAYYCGLASKQDITKKLDFLLGYILSQRCNYISKQKFLVESIEEASKSLRNIDYIWSGSCDIGNKSGADEIKAKMKSVKKHIPQFVDDCLLKIMQEKPHAFTENEKKYFEFLMIQVMTLGYKVTKNDFTDLLIFSSCDLYKMQNPECELSFITFDDRLKNFVKNGCYYNMEVYSSIFL